MKRIYHMTLTAAVVIACFFGVQLTANQPDSHYPDANAQELWQYITETSPYTMLANQEWHYLPGWEGRLEGKSPHGAGIVTYVNDIGYRAVQEKKETLPHHSIVVKENYAPAVSENKQSAMWPNAKLAAVTVMYKLDGYNPDANDWYWVKYNGDGSVDTKNEMKIAGKIQSCIGCHAAAGGVENDYLIGYDLEKTQPAGK